MKTDELLAIDEAIRLGLVITEPVDALPTKHAHFDMYLLTGVRDPRSAYINTRGCIAHCDYWHNT